VINNVEDGLLMSLAVTCDQQRSAVGPVLLIVVAVWPYGFGFMHPLNTATRDTSTDPKYVLSLSVPYCVIADSRRSCMSSRPNIPHLYLARANHAPHCC